MVLRLNRNGKVRVGMTGISFWPSRLRVNVLMGDVGWDFLIWLFLFRRKLVICHFPYFWSRNPSHPHFPHWLLISFLPLFISLLLPIFILVLLFNLHSCRYPPTFLQLWWTVRSQAMRGWSFLSNFLINVPTFSKLLDVYFPDVRDSSKNLICTVPVPSWSKFFSWPIQQVPQYQQYRYCPYTYTAWWKLPRSDQEPSNRIYALQHHYCTSLPRRCSSSSC